MPYGFDCGTYNLVSCHRDEDGNFIHKREVNAFLEMPLENRFVFNMMKTAGVPLIERGEVAYALGEAAINMAYTMPTIELKRPMKDGCVNPKERDAFEIMNIMMHSLLDVKNDGDLLYYSVPANAINQETDADYHGKILEAIFKAYQSVPDKFRINAMPINEALALVYAELANKAFTGIGISFGAGMVNLCFAMYGKDIFTFSIVNSGDWIDKQAARATGESITFINKEKEKIDLGKEPTTLVERAIMTQYNLMIEKTVGTIKKGLIDHADKKARLDHPVDIIIAGGTSSPPGFDQLFTKVLKNADLPIEIGKVIRPNDPLYSVARGCLIAAENATQ